MYDNGDLEAAAAASQSEAAPVLDQSDLDGDRLNTIVHISFLYYIIK